jgi:hypothetical protein
VEKNESQEQETKHKHESTKEGMGREKKEKGESRKHEIWKTRNQARNWILLNGGGWTGFAGLKRQSSMGHSAGKRNWIRLAFNLCPLSFNP